MPNTYKYASQVLYISGAGFCIYYCIIYANNRSSGQKDFPEASMEGSVLGAVVNIILDPIFISGTLGMGVEPEPDFNNHRVFILRRTLIMCGYI